MGLVVRADPHSIGEAMKIRFDGDKEAFSSIKPFGVFVHDGHAYIKLHRRIMVPLFDSGGNSTAASAACACFKNAVGLDELGPPFGNFKDDDLVDPKPRAEIALDGAWRKP
jgi:hypothetical protein